MDREGDVDYFADDIADEIITAPPHRRRRSQSTTFDSVLSIPFGERYRALQFNEQVEEQKTVVAFSHR
jgi:hypothetical protein